MPVESSADLGYLGAALVLNTLAPVMVKVTQNESGGYDYNKWCIYFFAELLKLVRAPLRSGGSRSEFARYSHRPCAW